MEDGVKRVTSCKVTSHKKKKEIEKFMTNFYKILIIAGIILIIAGTGVFILEKFSIPLGKLPGDIVIKNERFSFYFPLTTCIIVSIVISIIFYLIRK